MIKKKAYSTPEMTVVEMKHQSPLLAYSGAANAPEMDFDNPMEDVGIPNLPGVSVGPNIPGLPGNILNDF